jgi:membrane-associated phospholipid phosphatase
MSTAADLVRKRRIAAAAFAALLILSVFWPSPVVSINELCCNARLPIDDLSFLGREAPSWDVVFWCIAGLFALVVIHSAKRDDFREARDVLRSMRPRIRVLPVVLAFLVGAVLVAVTWALADQPVTALAESIESDRTEDIVRIANRFGGGMNPLMIILFLLLAGIAYRHRRWIAYAYAMAFAGAAAGVIGQIVKFGVGRARPELWLGAFRQARSSASSFPSGHTLGAFALGGVLMLASRSRSMRIVAFVLAAFVGVSRILAFRHWTSDVVASAVIGMVMAWIFVSPVTKSGDDAA